MKNYNIKKNNSVKKINQKYKKIIMVIYFNLLILTFKFEDYTNVQVKINHKKYIPNNFNKNMTEKDKLYIFFHLKEKPINKGDSLILKEKKELLLKLSKNKKQNISSIKFLYLKGKQNIGNFLISLNNAIFFCEILKCKKILIENSNLLIKHKIFDHEYNMYIEPVRRKSKKYLLKKSIVIYSNFFFYYYKYIKPGLRLIIIKHEILNNLPKVLTHNDDLFIHIRSGGIFAIPRNNSYSQPPLCFYEKILNTFKFRKVFIISENELNPVIKILINKHKYIYYNKNQLNIDISYLANSYNIVSSISSFLISIIKLNDNLKFLWEYDFYRLSSKFLHLHYSVYNFPRNYTIYKMKPSRYYKKIMYTWFNSPKQRKLMIKEKCKSNFIIIKPSI